MKTIQLKHPIKVEGTEIDSLTIRRPKVRDLKVIDQTKGEVARGIALVATLCDIPEPSVNEMDAEDFQAVSEVVGNFLGVAPPTGGK